MAEETKYTAKTGMVQISTANSGLDGSGSLGTVITGASNGTLIKSVWIKAITNTDQGMIRLFVDDGGTKSLIKEIPVEARTKASINPAFETLVDLNFTLESGVILKASTQSANTFNIIAEGLDWTYGSQVRMDTTKYTTNTGSVVISTANSNLDGTGALGLVYTAGSSATYNGSSIDSITIKASVSNTPGMVRLYLDDLTTKFLFKEIIIPSVTKSATDRSFERTIVFENDFELQAGYKIHASTQVAESFHVTAEGNDWNYYS
jgi:hypothetical protein